MIKELAFTTTVTAGIKLIIEEAHSNAKKKGFWDEETVFIQRNDAEMIALMHSELSEALKVIREYNSLDKYKDDLAHEFADVIIRIADFCGGRKIDLSKALIEKMKYNRTRKYKHGKRF